MTRNAKIENFNSISFHRVLTRFYYFDIVFPQEKDFVSTWGFLMSSS